MKKRGVGARTHDAELRCAVQDYLAAPMPFLVGLHSPNLFAAALRSSSLEEVVVVDLDRGTVRVGPANLGAAAWVGLCDLPLLSLAVRRSAASSVCQQALPGKRGEVLAYPGGF